MNLESSSSKNKNLPQLPSDDSFLDDFDFKPITSGLGFNHSQPEIKPVIYAEKTLKAPTPIQQAPFKKESNVYQNDLSLFYGQTQSSPQEPFKEIKAEVVYINAPKSQRIVAYVLDLSLILSVLSIVLTIMTKTIEMDLIEVWSTYPNEITPLVLVLFCGFYMMYFSIFEKACQSTLGKNLMGIRVVSFENKVQDLGLLVLRSFISLTSFVSLGLFFYFDLQNKVTRSKVIKVN